MLTQTETIQGLELYNRIFNRIHKILQLLGRIKPDTFIQLSLEEIDPSYTSVDTFVANWNDYYSGEAVQTSAELPVNFIWLSDAEIVDSYNKMIAKRKAMQRASERLRLQQVLNAAITYRDNAMAGAELGVERARTELERFDSVERLINV